MQCREFREIADSYLNNELMVETNHRVISHLEHCAECRQELKARPEWRGKLRRAFLQLPENQLRPEFADRLHMQLRDYAPGKHEAPPLVLTRGWQSYVTRTPILWIALAACLLLIIGAGLVLVRQRMVLGKLSGLDLGQQADRPDGVLVDRVHVIHVVLGLRHDAAEIRHEAAEHAGFVEASKRRLRIFA